MIHWNGVLDAEIGRLRALGLSWGLVAKKMGISLLVVQRRAKKIGIPTHRLNRGAISGATVVAGYVTPRRYKTHHRRWNDKLNAEIGRLRAVGLSWGSVGERMGMSRAVVQRHAEKIGIPKHRLNRGAISGVRMMAGYQKPDQLTAFPWSVRNASTQMDVAPKRVQKPSPEQ